MVVRGGLMDPVRAQQRVSQMVQALAHRGPDDSGVEEGVAAIFGATRLAIRGLIHGHQPLLDPSSGVIVVCNGEIDNHVELRAWLAERGHPVESDTDIAVIPGLYLRLGEAFVERLTGVFAIAVWDPRVGRLLLARDRAGERPLFFSVNGDTITFATEVAAIARDRSIALTSDQEAIRGYLGIGAFAAPATPFAEIEKVAPAEIVTIDSAGIERRRYWRWGIVESRKSPANEDEFDEVFRDAVRRQSDVDVEFGVFLSGGLDSSLAAAVLRSVRPDASLSAYTLRFREVSYDEGDYANAVAEYLGIGMTTVWCEPELVPAQLTALVRTAGEPLADPAWVPTALLSQRAAEDVKLCLCGEGGDEIFGGYPTYLGAQWADAYQRLPRLIRRAVAHCVERLPSSDKKMTTASLMKRFVAGVAMSGVERHRFWNANLSEDLCNRLCRSREHGSRRADDEVPLAGARTDVPPGAALLDVLQRIDLETSLAEGLATKSDRASMRSGLELRTPFLDRHVMEYAATLPIQDRVAGFETKTFLKEYALRYLPRRIVHRRKRGLSVPLSSWLRGPLESWARHRLASAEWERVGIDRGVLLELLEEHASRRADRSRALWALLVLAEWMEWAELRESEPGRAAEPLAQGRRA
jgi:asparagine synthase (glutamine-hydrolysing)